MEIINNKEFSKQETMQIKGIAVLMMVFLHLFCRKEFSTLYDVQWNINGLPVIYYISLLCSSCVQIYCFFTGYGLYIQYKHKKNTVSNIRRIGKLLLRFELIVGLTIISGYLLQIEDIMQFNFNQILKNITLLEHTICGAWWYIQTYVILILISPFLFKILDKHNTIIVVSLSIIIYCISYLQRVKSFFISNDSWIVSDIAYLVASLGFCQFSFMIGAIFQKYKIVSRVRNFLKNLKTIQIIIFDIIFLVALLLLHGKIESMFIDPIISIGLILIFSTIKFTNIKWLIFWGQHSTNIWLVHMLLYQRFFKKIIFSSRTPVIIFIVTLLLSLLISYFINGVQYVIQQFIENIIIKIRKNPIYNE